jgi:uncharacterized membrane protein YphA (DoxX/SURF4 family)
MVELQLTVDRDTRMDRVKRWLPRLSLGLLFMYVGQTKFNSDPHGTWVPVFERIGFGQWFRYFTGVMQIAGGILLLLPRTLTAGAALLACTMIGAILTDMFVMHSALFFVPTLLLVAIVVAWLSAR